MAPWGLASPSLSSLPQRDVHLKTLINYFIVIKQKKLHSIQKILTHPKQSQCFSWIYFLRGKLKCKFLKLKGFSPAKIILIPNKFLQTAQVTLGSHCFFWKKRTENRYSNHSIYGQCSVLYTGYANKSAQKFQSSKFKISRSMLVFGARHRKVLL